MGFWKNTVAVYVTREYGPSKTVGLHRWPTWQAWTASALIRFNVLLWGSVGLYEAGSRIAERIL